MLQTPLNVVSFLVLSVFLTAAAEKSVAVKGNLMCDGFPAGQILVRLFSIDEFGIHLLEQSFSDDAGHFDMLGRSDSHSDWRPVLNVYHDCGDAKNPGRRKMNFLLPKKYVVEGATPEVAFDLGTWNLQTSVKEDEERVDVITKRKRRDGEKKKAEARHRNSTLDRYEEPDDRVDPW